MRATLTSNLQALDSGFSSGKKGGSIQTQPHRNYPRGKTTWELQQNVTQASTNITGAHNVTPQQVVTTTKNENL